MINIREFLGLGYYTSQLDKFINEFRQKNQKFSASQRKESEKYSRIYALRDKTIFISPFIHNQHLWDKF